MSIITLAALMDQCANEDGWWSVLPRYEADAIQSALMQCDVSRTPILEEITSRLYSIMKPRRRADVVRDPSAAIMLR